MKIIYRQPDMTNEFRDTLHSYLIALFPGTTLIIGQGEHDFAISDVDDLRYFRRMKIVVIGLIELAHYVSREY